MNLILMLNCEVMRLHPQTDKIESLNGSQMDLENDLWVAAELAVRPCPCSQTPYQELAEARSRRTTCPSVELPLFLSPERTLTRVRAELSGRCKLIKSSFEDF